VALRESRHDWSRILINARKPRAKSDCANAGRRWLAHIEHAITQSRVQKHDSLQTVALERLILDILRATIEQNIKFQDTIVNHMDEKNGPPSVH
jgi:hypothetical protein